MWSKPTGKPADIQNRMDHFINELDHLDESMNAHQEADPFDDDGAMSWMSEGDETTPSQVSQGDHLDDVFEEPEENGASSSGSPVLGFLAAGAVLVSGVLWFVWPAADSPEVNQPVSQMATIEHAKVPPSVVAQQAGASDREPAARVTRAAVVHGSKTSIPTPSSDKTPRGQASLAAKATQQVVAKKHPSPTQTIVKAKRHGAAKVVTSTTAHRTKLEGHSKLLTVSVHLGLIRDAPNKTGKVVARLKKGTQVVGLSREGDWYKVRFPDGRIVWGHRSIF